MDSDRTHGASGTGASRSSGSPINASQDALVIVGQSTLEQAVDKAGMKAEKHVAREPGTSPKDIGKAIREAASQVS